MQTQNKYNTLYNLVLKDERFLKSEKKKITNIFFTLIFEELPPNFIKKEFEKKYKEGIKVIESSPITAEILLDYIKILSK